MASRGRMIDVAEHRGFVAEADGEWLGYATYDIGGDALEMTALEALFQRRGAGTALLGACVALARDQDLGRVWLVTTNDNLEALRFYQRRGFVIVAFHRDSVTRMRENLKPEIPLIGAHGISIRDELELELPTAEWPGIMAATRGH